MSRRTWLAYPIAALALSVGSTESWAALSGHGSTTAQETVEPGQIRDLIRDGHYADAETHASRLLEQVEATSGRDSLDAARVLDLLVEALWRGGKTNQPETRQLAERAVSIKEETIGDEDPDLAVSLDNLGIVVKRTGDLAAGKLHFERSLAIRESSLPADHPDTAYSLDYLGIILYQQGEFTRAARIYERAIRIREKALGQDHLDVSLSLNYLGVLLWETGDYAAARPLYERALAIRRKHLAPEHPLVPGVLNNLAILLDDMGEYDAARRLYEEALDIRKKTLRPDHPNVARTLSNLAHVMWREGDLGEAKRLVEQALAIWDSREEPDDLSVAPSLDLLGILEYSSGNYAAARRTFERAVASCEPALGPDHPRVAVSLIGLANSLRDSGEPRRAQPLYEKALSTWTRNLGPDHPYVATGLKALATNFFRMGDGSRCLATALRAERSGMRHLRLTSRGMAERESLRYASVRATGLDLALTLAARGLDAAGRRDVLDALIRSRAVVVDEIAARHRSLCGTDDPELVELSRRLASARTKLANLMVRGLSSPGSGRYMELIEEAREEKELAERILANKSGRDQTRRQVGLDEVAENLPQASALVAFAQYLHHDTRSKEPVPSYLAFVLKHGDPTPAVAPLGEAAEIDALISRWKQETARGALVARRTPNGAEAAYRQVGEKLRRRLWDPIADRLGQMQLVFTVPDGAPQLVSLATLPVGEKRYLVESVPLLHYLSAERDLVLMVEGAAKGRGLLALGDAAFDATTLFAAASNPNEREPDQMQEAASEPAFRSRRSTCGKLESLRFESLPATALEVQEIAALWDRRNRPASLSLTGASASEANFKRLARGKRVLHVATHGFFLNGDCPSALQNTRGIGGLKPADDANPLPLVGENPLLLPGLALAGANNRALCGPGEEDGILTAEEIAALDLSGVEWAVLSACDTGVGEVMAGEGVFGMRRAFQIAGVHTLVMSLWSVEDVSTREWMRLLYRARLNGASTAEAVRRASLESIEDRRRTGRDTHPFFWGGFVATGDWR